MFSVGKAFPTVITLLAGVLVVLTQSDTEDFISLAGQFVVKLPQKYAEYRSVVNQQVLGKSFNGGAYRWDLGNESVVIIYADGAIDLETPVGSDSDLKAVRDENLKRFPGASILGEKKTSLDTHPGLISVLQSDKGRVMIWCYVVKNRFYVLSLTLNDASMIESNVNQLWTFRLATRNDLEPRYARLIAEMTPESLSQDVAGIKASSDIDTQRLKGKVRRIVTETEPYFDGEPSGVRYLSTDEQFNERGFLSRAVSFKAGLPDTVRVYGFISGDRVYREQRKPVEYAFISSDPKSPGRVEEAKSGNALLQQFKLKYRYDQSGVLVETRLIREDSQEWEKYTLSPGKLEHVYFPSSANLNFKKPLESDKYKDVETLDAGGNVIETKRTLRDNDKAEYTTIDGKVQVLYHEQYKTETYRYKYEFDDRGNWIRRVSIRIDTKKETSNEVALLATYRTITYY